MDLLLYWLFFELIGCFVAGLVIPLLTFGRAYVHPRSSSPGRFNWLGYRRDDAGRIVVGRDVAGFIGFMIIIIVFLAVVLVGRPL